MQCIYWSRPINVTSVYNFEVSPTHTLKLQVISQKNVWRAVVVMMVVVVVVVVVIVVVQGGWEVSRH